jgi:hypothetical protein
MQSPSRQCFVRHGATTEDAQNAMTAQQRFALQMDIFAAIDQQVFETDEGIFDRTHLDNLFYAIWQCRELVTNDHYMKMYVRMMEGLNTFDVIFFAPIYDWGDNTDDGMRTQHLPSRHLMDSYIHRQLNHRAGAYAQGYVTLRNEPVEDRLRKILNRVEYYREVNSD